MATTAEIQKLYIAYFNRPAEPDGLAYWAASSMSLKEISNSFAVQKEYAEAYAGLSTTQVVNTIYKNLFGHEADFAGLNYWVSEIRSGKTTLGTAAFMILSGATGADKTAIDSKVTAAEAFTKAIDTTAEAAAYDTVAGKILAKQWLGKVVDAGTLATATAAIDATLVAIVQGGVQNVALTSGTDTLSGETFKAELVYTPGGDKRINSLQDEDKITGTGANNVLDATLGNANDNGGTTITPSLTNINTINVAFTGSSNAGNVSNNAVNVLDLQDSSGLKVLNVSRITDPNNSVTIDNMTSVPTDITLNNSNSPSGTQSFTFTTQAVAGTTDATKFTLNNVKTAGLTLQAKDTTAGIETINLVSSGSANSVGVFTAQDVKTLNISGNQNLTLGARSNTINGANAQPEATRYAAGLSNVGGSLTKVDGSTFTGNLDFTIGTEMNAGLDNTSGVNVDMAVIGGSGNDIFRLATGTNVDDKDTITGGAADGKDSNTLVLLGNNTVAGTVSKVQSLEVRTGHDAGTGADTVSVDASKITDLAKIYIRNEGQDVAGTTWNSAAEAATVSLTKLNATQAGNITVAHGTTGNSALANLTVNVSASSSASATGVTIVDGTNTNPVFNFRLNTNSKVVNITDSDTESNTLYLNTAPSGAGSKVTLAGGATGSYFNFDTNSGNSAAAAVGRASYGYATDGSTGSNTTAVTAAGNLDYTSVFTVYTAAAADRILAEEFDGSAYKGDITVRFGDITRADGVSSQSIKGGEGNDTFIFDALTHENAGFTSADTIAAGKGTDALIIDGNTTLLAGTPRVNHNTSEWDNVTGIDVLRFVKNEGVANVGNGAIVTVTGGGYYAHIDNDFISQTDAGNRLVVVNNDGDSSVNSESDLVLDLTGLSQLKFVTFVGANGQGAAGLSSNRVIVDDVSANQNMKLDGGDSNLNSASGNNNLLQVNNAANISLNDLAQTKNFGRISFTNDTAVTQVSQLTLNDTLVDALVDASQSASATNVERLSINALDSTSQAAATVGLSLRADSLSNKSALDVTLGRGSNIVSSGAGSDRVVLLGNYVAGTYNATENGVNVDQQSTAGAVARVVTDTISLGDGNDTLVTYGAINLAGANLSGIEAITANSALVITASQYLALIAARTALSLSGPVLTFTGNTSHQLTIVDDIGGVNNIDLSYISVTSGSLLYDVTSASNAIGGNVNNITTSNSVQVSNGAFAIAGTIGTTPTNGGGVVNVNTGAVNNGVTGRNEQFMVSIPGLNGTTIAGNASDNDSLTLTTAGTVVLNNGSTGGTLSNLKTLNLANGTNNITYNTSAGFSTINGGTGDDTITPDSSLMPININGGAGTDTIVLTASYAATASGNGTFASKVSGFEKLQLNSVTNQTIDLQMLGNYSDVILASGSMGVTLTNVANNGRITLTGNGTALTLANSAFAAGLNDTLNFTLTSGSGTSTNFMSGGLLASNVENMVLNLADTQATPSGTFKNTFNVIGNTVKSFVISGNAGLTLTANSTALTNVDASGISLGGFNWTSGALANPATVKGSASGNNVLNFDLTTASINYQGGTGNDNVTIKGGYLHTVALGNGNNTLNFDSTAMGGSYSAGTGTDTLVLNSNYTYINNATVTGFDNLTLQDNATLTLMPTQWSQFTGTIIADGQETVNFSSAGFVVANSAIEIYNLANGNNTFVSADVATKVYSLAGDDNFNFTANQIVNFLDTIVAGTGTDTLTIGTASTQNINLSTKISGIEIVNANGSTGNTSFTNLDGAGVVLNFSKSTGNNTISLGSGGQTLNLLGTSSAATTVTGGAVADTISLPSAGGGSETLIANGAMMSTRINTDVVGNFNASGIDYFKTGVNATSLGSYLVVSADVSNYIATLTSGLSIVLNNTAQAYLITIQNGTAAGTYLFQNTGSNTAQFDDSDFFVKLVGNIGSLSNANLIA